MRRILALLLLAAAVLVLPAAGRADPPPTPVVYIVGDSILAEEYMPAGATFAAKLAAKIPTATVVNVAHGGQRCWVGTNSLEAQWPSIVDATPAPTTIIVSIGMNDVGVTGVTNQQIVDCWNWLYFNPASGSVARGIRVIPCLLVPVSSSRPDVEQQRLFEDAWLGGFFGAGAVADFVTPLKSSTSEWVNPAFSWDPIHPNWLGTSGMLAYFPLTDIE